MIRTVYTPAIDHFFDDLLPASECFAGPLHGSRDFGEKESEHTRKRYAKGRTCPICALDGIQQVIVNDARYCTYHSRVMSEKLGAFRRHERAYLDALGVPIPDWLHSPRALHPNCHVGGSLDGVRIVKFVPTVQE